MDNHLVQIKKSVDEVYGSNRGKRKVKKGESSLIVPGGGLAGHEAKGGHLIARHVGKTDEELFQRLKSDSKITAASTFIDRAVAEKVASKVLGDPINKQVIQNWSKNPKK